MGVDAALVPSLSEARLNGSGASNGASGHPLCRDSISKPGCIIHHEPDISHKTHSDPPQPAADGAPSRRPCFVAAACSCGHTSAANLGDMLACHVHQGCEHDMHNATETPALFIPRATCLQAKATQ